MAIKISQKVKRVVYTILLISIPVILWSLPSTHFDEGTSISIFALLGVEDYVYSTGMTRAVMHLLHLDIQTAMEYNKLSFIVLPLLMMYWLKLLLKQFNIDIRLLRWI